MVGSLLQLPAPLREALREIHSAPQNHMGTACEHGGEEEHLTASSHIELPSQGMATTHNDGSIFIAVLALLHPLSGGDASVGRPRGEAMEAIGCVEAFPLSQDVGLLPLQLAVVPALHPIKQFASLRVELGTSNHKARPRVAVAWADDGIAEEVLGSAHLVQGGTGRTVNALLLDTPPSKEARGDDTPAVRLTCELVL